MPKSKHRKKFDRPRIKRRILDKQAEARQKIYDLARPEHQEYPPLAPESRDDKHKHVMSALTRAEEIRERRRAKHRQPLKLAA